MTVPAGEPVQCLTDAVAHGMDEALGSLAYVAERVPKLLRSRRHVIADVLQSLAADAPRPGGPA
jgi:hypothetical protein